MDKQITIVVDPQYSRPSDFDFAEAEEVLRTGLPSSSFRINDGADLIEGPRVIQVNRTEISLTYFCAHEACAEDQKAIARKAATILTTHFRKKAEAARRENEARDSKRQMRESFNSAVIAVSVGLLGSVFSAAAHSFTAWLGIHF